MTAGQRFSVGCVVLTLAILWLAGGSARAQSVVSLQNDFTLDSGALLFASNATYGRAINGEAFQTESLLTYGGYQYATWYHLGASDEDVYLGRRSLASSTWEVMDTGANMTRTTSDAHNVISLGISGDGAMHISWDHHGQALKYMKTSPGAATGATWNASLFGAERSSLNLGGTSISSVTYPRFVTDSNTGDMLFVYRSGSSGNGDMNLATYGTTTGLWNTPHQFINGTSGLVYTDALGSSSTRNAYLNGVDIDSTGRLQTTWTWRESAGGTNHDICYAYSDNGGATWKNGAGTSLGSLINLNSSGIMIDDGNPGNGILGQIDRRNTVMNQQTQAVDLDGTVHAIMWHADDAHRDAVSGFTTTPAAYFHYFRDPATGDWSRKELPTDRAVGSRPDMAYDAAGNLYVAYVSAGPGDLGGYYTDGDLVIASATKAAGYDDWQIVYTDTRDFSGEPRIDQKRLLTDGVLSIFLQENNDLVTSITGTPLHVLDFAISTTLTWTGDSLGTWNTSGSTDWDTNNDSVGNAAFANGNSVRFGDGAATFAVHIANPVSPSSTTFLNAAHTYSFTGAGIGGSGGLSVSGGGTVTLANGANTYTGDTQVDNGTLALTGAATIAASPNINVAVGGTLNVTGVAGGAYTLNNQTLTTDGAVAGNLVATNGSTVNVNSSNAVTGNVTAQSASLIAGAGQITGNLSAQASSVVRVGGVGLNISLSGFVVDDFQSYATGDVRTVASPPWTAHANTTLADIETDGASNQVLSFGSSGAAGTSRDLPVDGQIDDSETATFFFRFNSRTDDPDHNFGLGDQATVSGVNFPDFEAQVRVVDDPVATGTFLLDARNGGSFSSTLASGLNTNSWYNVWMVIDQTTDTYDVYLNTGTADAGVGNKLNASPLFFRNGTTSTLNKILGLANSAPINNGVLYDDLTFFSGVNLTNPLNGLDSALVGSGETLTITGDFAMTSGATLELDIATPAIIDLLNVGGHFSAGGTLAVALAAGAPAPELGNAFDLLDFASASGAFDAFTLPSLAAGLVWNVSGLLTTGELSVVVDVDLDNDGWVTGNDFLAIQRTNPSLIAQWQAQYGSQVVVGTGLVGAATAVPEPAVLALVALSLMMGSLFRPGRVA